MHAEYLHLIQSTLSFLRGQMILPPTVAPSPSVPLPKPTHTPIAMESKQPTLPPPKHKQIKISPQVQLKNDSSILQKMASHLPHLQFLDAIPLPPQRVALVAIAGEDPLFFQMLKDAIEKRFCSVDLIEMQDIPKVTNWDLYTLVLSTREVAKVGKKKQILLAPIALYQNNAREKKQLWLSLCHHLSQK